MAGTKTMKNQVAQESTFDYSLLLITLCLIGFGLLMIYSSSSYTAQVRFGSSTTFLKKQLLGVAVGLLVMFVVSRIHHMAYIKQIPLIRIRLVTVFYWLAVFLQVLVLVVADDRNGAKRWLQIGPLSLQPSEIVKFVVILMTAYFIQRQPQQMGRWKGIIMTFAPAVLLILLVGKENMSTAIVLALITGGMCLISAKEKRWYFLVVLLGIGAALLYVRFGDAFRMERFQIWQNVETHPKGYQILQGLYAIASGGLFGTGLGESMQKLGFIPESHNDMIFSIICEELGLVGAAIVLLMFFFMLWRILTIAMRAPDLYSSMICVGVLIHIAAQVVLNVAVVTNSMPSTGIPLPFISYGGTSVAILLAEMGLVLSVSNQIRGY